MVGGRITQPVISLSSICIGFCVVVLLIKQAVPQKSEIKLLACIDQRYVLYQELMLELVFIFGMI
jgi:hypothetical protein